MADERPGPGARREEMVDAPPFFSWRAIYAIVLGALAVEIAIAATVTVLFR
jgi:hypothetical protein